MKFACMHTPVLAELLSHLYIYPDIIESDPRATSFVTLTMLQDESRRHVYSESKNSRLVKKPTRPREGKRKTTSDFVISHRRLPPRSHEERTRAPGREKKREKEKRKAKRATRRAATRKGVQRATLNRTTGTNNRLFSRVLLFFGRRRRAAPFYAASGSVHCNGPPEEAHSSTISRQKERHKRRGTYAHKTVNKTPIR